MSEKVDQKAAFVIGKYVLLAPLMPNGAYLLVGAGIGGVATAARLAKAGFKVTVFEKNDFTGGRCSLIHHDGYVKRYPYCAMSEPVLTLCSALRPRPLSPPPSSSLP